MHLILTNLQYNKKIHTNLQKTTYKSAENTYKTAIQQQQKHTNLQ
jgi:hypothetical protein